MKVPDISEEERSEIYTALQERKEALEKLSKDTDKRHVPTDRIDERLAIYRDGDQIIAGEKCVKPGLISLFAPEPQLSTEARAAKDGGKRDPAGQQDIFGGGAETGGGAPAGGTDRWAVTRHGNYGDAPHTPQNGDGGPDNPEGFPPPRLIGSGAKIDDPRANPAPDTGSGGDDAGL